MTGRAYQFSVVAHNFNGVGTPSSSFSYYSCILPTGFVAPTRRTSTATSIEIEWKPPTDDGGCSITGYAIFMDDGLGAGNFAEVNTVNDLNFRN